MLMCSLSVPRLRVACCRTMSSSAGAGPIFRKFVPVEQSEVPSSSKPDGSTFRVISYNILAQAYVKSSYFPHSPAPCLRWKARSQAILSVLKGLEADIFCLQEVDNYDTFYKRNMKDLGYESVHTQRSGRKCDGCGIFYKLNSAELVIEEKIDYNDLVDLVEDGKISSFYEHSDAVIAEYKEETTSSSKIKDGQKNHGDPNDLVDLVEDGKISSVYEHSDAVITEYKEETTSSSKIKDGQKNHGDPNDPRVRLKRDCVGIMALFRLKNPLRRHIIIANTHLYWDPEWADVKMAQARYLLSRLARFRNHVSSKYDCSPSIILAGDFNSVPGSQVYNYLTSDPTGPETANDEHPPLSSVYAFTRGEPEFTNCTPSFTDTLDYIFFSTAGDVKPVGYLELPVAESSDVTGCLPNYFHPSDHLPIGAEFEVEE